MPRVSTKRVSYPIRFTSPLKHRQCAIARPDSLLRGNAVTFSRIDKSTAMVPIASQPEAKAASVCLIRDDNSEFRLIVGDRRKIGTGLLSIRPRRITVPQRLRFRPQIDYNEEKKKTKERKVALTRPRKKIICSPRVSTISISGFKSDDRERDRKSS